MTAPALTRIDHVHVFVRDRAAAAATPYEITTYDIEGHP